jgi:hypothetical protein
MKSRSEGNEVYETFSHIFLMFNLFTGHTSWEQLHAYHVAKEINDDMKFFFNQERKTVVPRFEQPKTVQSNIVWQFLDNMLSDLVNFFTNLVSRTDEIDENSGFELQTRM